MDGTNRPLEVTLVEKSAINPWRYPPHFNFQYGEWLRPSFEKGVLEPWNSPEMPDLAPIVTQVLLRNQNLLGEDAEKHLPKVPARDFMRAMMSGLDRLVEELGSDTRNVLLILARIWSTVKTGEIRSKPAAAKWAIRHLEPRFLPPMERALSICKGLEEERWEDLEEILPLFAKYLVNHIREAKSPINLNDPSLSIRLSNDHLV